MTAQTYTDRHRSRAHLESSNVTGTYTAAMHCSISCNIAEHGRSSPPRVISARRQRHTMIASRCADNQHRELHASMLQQHHHKRKMYTCAVTADGHSVRPVSVNVIRITKRHYIVPDLPPRSSARARDARCITDVRQMCFHDYISSREPTQVCACVSKHAP